MEPVLQKSVGARLVKKNPAFYGDPKPITTFTVILRSWRLGQCFRLGCFLNIYFNSLWAYFLRDEAAGT
jgi:hypothetical protein